MRQVSSTNSVPEDFTGAYGRALVERGAAISIEGPDPQDPTLVRVEATFLRPDASVDEQQWVSEQCAGALGDASVPRHRNYGSGIGVADFHPDSRYVDIIEKASGVAIGLKITAHDQESAETGARQAAEALGISPDAVTALWSPGDV